MGKEESSGCQGAVEHNFNYRTISEYNQVEHYQKSSDPHFVFKKKKKSWGEGMGTKMDTSEVQKYSYQDMQLKYPIATYK